MAQLQHLDLSLHRKTRYGSYDRSDWEIELGNRETLVNLRKAVEELPCTYDATTVVLRHLAIFLAAAQHPGCLRKGSDDKSALSKTTSVCSLCTPWTGIYGSTPWSFVHAPKILVRASLDGFLRGKSNRFCTSSSWLGSGVG